MLYPRNMNVPLVKRLWPIAAALLITAGVALWWMTERRQEPRYVTAQVDRGSVIRSVTATGTVNPVIVVQVGTYDSGPIIAIYADFNSPVKAGQLIAKIDPRPFTVKVHQAEAALGNAQAQLGKDQADLAYKKLTFERDARLHAENVISQDTLDNARSAFQQAVSAVALDRSKIKQQQANLHEAQVNLDYTNIISPVDGTVVSRNVDVGQTVAASFQTPTLFLIAKDLTQMQVDTNVSESDIGNVRDGQTAEFTRRRVSGSRCSRAPLAQVRQAPITVQNVVTYDVVVSVRESRIAAQARDDRQCDDHHRRARQRAARSAPGAALLAARRPRTHGDFAAPLRRAVASRRGLGSRMAANTQAGTRS